MADTSYILSCQDAKFSRIVHTGALTFTRPALLNFTTMLGLLCSEPLSSATIQLMNGIMLEKEAEGWLSQVVITSEKGDRATMKIKNVRKAQADIYAALNYPAARL